MFTNKVIVVTGASQGIGWALVKTLANHNAKLVIAARDHERLNELKAQLKCPRSDVLVVPTDIADEKQCRELIEKSIAHFGQLDYLVNNAGITMWSRFDELQDLSIFNKIHQVNVMGAVYCSHYALPHLKKTQGALVAVASMAGLTGVPSRTAYAASKHAMIGFFESLRIEQQDNNVDVVIIAPDFVVSQIHKRAIDKDGNALGKSPMQEQKIMSSEACATIIVDAMKNKKRLTLTSFRGKVGRWLKMLAPKVIDNIAARAINKRH